MAFDTICADGHRLAVIPLDKVSSMIKLSHLGGEPFILNAELIKYVEARPDTFITLTGGDRIVVEQSPEEVMKKTLEYHQSKHLIPSPY